MDRALRLPDRHMTMIVSVSLNLFFGQGYEIGIFGHNRFVFFR